ARHRTLIETLTLTSSAAAHVRPVYHQGGQRIIAIVAVVHAASLGSCALLPQSGGWAGGIMQADARPPSTCSTAGPIQGHSGGDKIAINPLAINEADANPDARARTRCAWAHHAEAHPCAAGVPGLHDASSPFT